MSVYVDDMKTPYGRMIMCHMIADTLPELHEMADRIGIKRRWFQDKPNHPHYDISISKRILAVRYGAKEISAVEGIAILRNRYGFGLLRDAKKEQEQK